MSTALQPTSIESVIEARLKELPFPKTTAVDPEGKTYQQVHDEQIGEIEKRAKMIPPVVDEATRASTQKALTALVKVRRGIDTFRKDLFAPLNDLKKKFDGYLGTTMDGGLQARIRAIEIPLEESMAKYDRELERIRQEEIKRIEDRNKARASFVIEAGMTFTGAEYRLDDLVLWPTDMNTWNDDAFDNWKIAKLQPALQAKADREKAAREVAEKAAAEAKAQAEALAAAQAKQKADEEKLAAERAELEREKEKMADERAEGRAIQLVNLGAVAHGYGPAAMRYEIGEVIVGHGELRHMDAETFAATCERVREATEANAERIRRSSLNDERSRILLELQHHRYDGEQVWTCGDATVTDAQLATMTDEEWAVVLAKFHEEEERLNNVPAEPEVMHYGHLDVPMGLATEENPDFRAGMEAVHVAPLVEQEREIDHEGAALIFDAMQYATKQNCSAFILPAGEKFVVYGTAAHIRELLNGQ